MSAADILEIERGVREQLALGVADAVMVAVADASRARALLDVCTQPHNKPPSCTGTFATPALFPQQWAEQKVKRAKKTNDDDLGMYVSLNRHP